MRRKLLVMAGHIMFLIHSLYIVLFSFNDGLFIPLGWDVSYYMANLRLMQSNILLMLENATYQHFLIYFVLYPFSYFVSFPILIIIFQIATGIIIYAGAYKLFSCIPDEEKRDIAKTFTFAFLGLYLLIDVLANRLALCFILWGVYFMLTKHPKLGFTLFIISIFSHLYTTFFFSVVLSVVYYLNNSKKQTVLFFIVAVISLLWIFLTKPQITLIKLELVTLETETTFLGNPDLAFYLSMIAAIMILPLFPFIAEALGHLFSNSLKYPRVVQLLIISSMLEVILSIFVIPTSFLWAYALVYGYRTMYFFFQPLFLAYFVSDERSYRNIEFTFSNISTPPRLWMLLLKIDWSKMLPVVMTFTFTMYVLLTRSSFYLLIPALFASFFEIAFFLRRWNSITSHFDQMCLIAAIFNATVFPLLDVHFYLHYPFLLYYYTRFSRPAPKIEKRIMIITSLVVFIFLIASATPMLAYAAGELVGIGWDWVLIALLTAGILAIIILGVPHTKKKFDSSKSRHIFVLVAVAIYSVLFVSNGYVVCVRPEWIKNIRAAASLNINNGNIITVYYGALSSNKQFIGNHWWETYNNWVTSEWQEHNVYVGRLEYLHTLKLPPFLPSYGDKVVVEYYKLVNKYNNNAYFLMTSAQIIVFRKLYVPPLPLSPNSTWGITELIPDVYLVNLSLLESHKDNFTIYVLPLCDLISTNATYVKCIEENYTLNGYDYKVAYSFTFRAPLEMRYFLPRFPENGNVTVRINYFSNISLIMNITIGNESRVAPLDAGAHEISVVFPGGTYTYSVIVISQLETETIDSKDFTLLYLSY